MTKTIPDILFIHRQIWLGTVHDILSNRKVFILLCCYTRQLQNVYDENLTKTFYLFIDKFDWGQYMTYYQIEKIPYYYVIYDENHTRTFYLFIDKFDWGQYMTYYQIEKFTYYYVAIEGSNKMFMTKTIPGHFIYL